MKSIKFSLAIFSLISMLSCQDQYFGEDGDLDVRVVGYLSGNIREDIQVQVYRSREDAEDQYDALTDISWTNGRGEVYIEGLPEGRCYYVRADSYTTKSIRTTDKILEGSNAITVRIL